jgi:uncharacterized protein YggE
MTNKSALTVFVTGVACSAVAVASIILSAKLLGPLPISVNQTTTQKQSTFDVSGESEVSVIPDEATVSMGIEVNRPRVVDAQNEVNKVMLDVVGQLKGLGIDDNDITTTQYTVYPEYDYTSSTRRTTGYRVSSTVRVKIRDFAKVNEVIDSATAQGVTNVNGVTFNLSEEKEEETKKAAREEAIEEARKNAQELSDLAGMRLGKIVNIYEIPQYDNPPVAYDMVRNEAAMGGGPDTKTEIQPGSSSYTYSVTISYETL